VENLHTITHGEERISSTRVREALAHGDLEQARHLLGRRYAMRGRVAHGDKRGRSIGFPTANLALHRRVSPLSGVYAVAVRDLDDGRLAGARPPAWRPADGRGWTSLWPAVANVGHRPTVDGQDVRLEVHLFDFDGDLYGAHLEVEFRLKLRAERRFESFAALKQQIDRDAAAARAFLGIA
jgi:riboflavin kinase/FMN adenylyltransferase